MFSSLSLRILQLPLGFYIINLGFEKESLSPPQADFFYDSDWLTLFSLHDFEHLRPESKLPYDFGACGAQVRSGDIVLKYARGPLRALKYACGENTPHPLKSRPELTLQSGNFRK